MELAIKNTSMVSKARIESQRRIGILVLAAIVFALGLPLGWWMIASDYSDDAIAGTYQVGSGENSYSLILKPDHTFDQALSNAGKIEHAAGTWRTFGESHISFSKEFSIAAGQERSSNGQVYAVAQRKFGLFLIIIFNPDPSGPVYHKKLFS